MIKWDPLLEMSENGHDGVSIFRVFASIHYGCSMSKKHDASLNEIIPYLDDKWETIYHVIVRYHAW